MQILDRLQHQNIVRIFDSFESKSHVCFVMELCAGGDLLSYIKRRKRLTEDTAAHMFSQVCHAVEYCHSHSIAHRDIKPDNILLREEGKVKLCDFGCSKVMRPKESFSDEIGTPAFMAPEIFRKEQYHGAPADVWSLGVLLYVMVTGMFPFISTKVDEIPSLVVKGEFTFPKSVQLSDQIRKLIKSCLTQDINLRPSISQILKHEWFKVVNEVTPSEIFT